jgi:hypothetical protein
VLVQFIQQTVWAIYVEIFQIIFQVVPNSADRSVLKYGGQTLMRVGSVKAGQHRADFGFIPIGLPKIGQEGVFRARDGVRKIKYIL